MRRIISTTFEVGSRNLPIAEFGFRIADRKDAEQKAEANDFGSGNAEVGNGKWEVGMRKWEWGSGNAEVGKSSISPLPADPVTAWQEASVVPKIHLKPDADGSNRAQSAAMGSVRPAALSDAMEPTLQHQYDHRA